VAKTSIEWTFTPDDFLEAPLTITIDEGRIEFGGGKATVEMDEYVDPVPDTLIERIEARITEALLARQLLTHQQFQLQPVHSIVREDDSGRRAVIMKAQAAEFLFLGYRADVLVRAPDGTIITDTKTERITNDAVFIERIRCAARRSPLVRSLLDSYSSAVRDPEDELVHLYEIRDAISRHYGGEAKARPALGITKAEWDVLGVLANAEPLEQGRHRGKHQVRRSATPAELERARNTARSFIEAVVAKV
jgi:hypothetical protein